MKITVNGITKTRIELSRDEVCEILGIPKTNFVLAEGNGQCIDLETLIVEWTEPSQIEVGS